MSVQAVPTPTVEPPRGFPPYRDTCGDPRFTTEIRNYIEGLCRRLINRRNKLKRDPNLDENQWFNERVQSDKGPLHMVSRFVRGQPGDESFVLVLGAATCPAGEFAISTATYDYPWFTSVMNDFCNSTTDEAFNAWQLTFDRKGSIGAKALCDDSVAMLSNEDKDLLVNVGFRIPGHHVKLKKETRGKKAKAKSQELDPNDPLYDLHVNEQRFAQGWKKIRSLTRRIRMTAGMTRSRREKISELVDQFNKKCIETLTRLKICPEQIANPNMSLGTDPSVSKAYTKDIASASAPVDVADCKRAISSPSSALKKARTEQEKDVLDDPAAVGSEAVHDGYETDPEEPGKGWKVIPPK